MKAAVIVFPGSNCDRDCAVAVERSTGARVEMVWHKDTVLPDGLDLIVLPGGFSYGDYLRCGAMAALSPVMKEVIAAANRGVATVGICNGFQILCEAGLLPGALLRNEGLKYVCKPIALEVTNAQTRFTAGYQGRRDVTMTIGNGEGNFFADKETLARIEGEGQVVLGMMPHPDRAFEADLGSADGAILFQSALASA
jgi:phosphoribosylformylglycinamidine synthase I